MRTRAGSYGAAVLIGVLNLGVFSPQPARAGQPEQLEKLGTAARHRREELLDYKAGPAARWAVGGEKQAALLEKLQAAARRQSRASSDKPASQAQLAPQGWREKLQRLSRQQPQLSKPPAYFPAPKVAATQQADEDAGGPVALTYDTGELAGQLLPLGDVDGYQFEGQLGEVLDIALSSGEFDAYLELEYEGEVVAVDDDGGEGTNSLIDDFTLPASGTYLVRVHAYSDAGAGAYTFSVSEGGAPVVYQGTLAQGLADHTLDQAGSIYLYLLTVDQLSQVQVRLNSEDFDTFLSLYAGSAPEDRTEANLLGVDDDGGGGTNSLLSQPLEAGTYLVEVRAFSAGDTGAFELELVSTPLGADEDSAGPVTLELGQTLAGGLFPQGDTDAYVFDAAAGDVIDLSLESEDFDAYLELMISDEAIAVDDDGGEGTNALIDDFVIPTSGTYLVVVHAYSDAGEGRYTVGATRQQAPWTLIGQLEPGPVSGLAEQSGVLEQGGAIHIYTFTLSQLTQVQLELNSEDFDAYLTLYAGQGLEDLSPENQIAADDDGGGSLNALLALPLEAGDYLVEVRSFDREATGVYILSLQQAVLGADEDQAGSIALSYGVPLSGGLFPAGDIDLHSFAGQAGEVVDISLESEDFDAFVELEFAGELIAVDDDGGEGFNSLISGFVLPFGGAYGVRVHALGDEGTGAYRLGVDDVTPPISANTQVGTGSLSGQISEVGQLQLYPFALDGPAAVEIELLSDDFDAFLSLYRGGGVADRSAENLLAEDDDGGEGVNSRLELLLPAGQYLIEARPLISGTTGSFTLQLSAEAVADDEDQSAEPSLLAGQAREGRLSPAGDVDTYILDGTAGQVVAIGVESEDFDPYVELVRGDEVLAADDDGGEDLNSLIGEYALPFTGAYQVRVHSYADQGAGAYTLSLQSGSDLLVLNTAIEPGNYTGQLSAEGQLQFYPFRLQDRAQVQLGLSATRYALSLALYQGAVLADRQAANLVGSARALAAGEQAQFTQELPAGNYLLEVGTAQEGQTGAYSLSFKTAALQEARDRVSLVSGQLNQTPLAPFSPTLKLSPGAKISGQLEVEVENTHPRSEIFQLVLVQSWGERQTGYRAIEGRVLSGSTRHSVGVDLAAPQEAGTYHLIVAAAAEPAAADIASGTHWESGVAPRWGDGDDLAAWSSQRLEQAIQQGWVEVEWFENYRTQIGACAVEVVVEEPEPASTGPVALDFDAGQGDQGLRRYEGASPGQTIQVQLHVEDAPGISGWGLQLQFNPDQLRYVGSSFAPGTFIPGLVPLVAEAAGQVEVGGAVLGSAASNSGSGLLGSLSFEVLPGFSASTTLRATQISFRTLDQGRIKQSIQAVGTISGGSQEQTGPISMDFDLAAGDQQQRQKDGVRAGDAVQVQLNVQGAPQMKGWSARLEYDPTQLRYVSGSFAPSLFIPGLVSLVGEKEGRVDLGGTVLGSGDGSAGDGALGTFSFEVLNGFSSSAELVISRISFNTTASGEVAQETHAVATLSAQAALPADFDGNGAVDFSDFFLFADHFGQSEGEAGWDASYDLSGNGEVDFSDFFLFADNFGREAQAKLLALARQLLGLPREARLEQNYPNPFNASTQIRYQLNEPALVVLEVYDLAGQRIRTLEAGVQEAGMYQVAWDGRDGAGAVVASGIYFYRLSAGDFTQVRRMSYIR